MTNVEKLFRSIYDKSYLKLMEIFNFVSAEQYKALLSDVSDA